MNSILELFGCCNARENKLSSDSDTVDKPSTEYFDEYEINSCLKENKFGANENIKISISSLKNTEKNTEKNNTKTDLIFSEEPNQPYITKTI